MSFDLKGYVKKHSFKDDATVVTEEYMPGLKFTLRFVTAAKAAELWENATDMVFEGGRRRVKFNSKKYAAALADIIIGWEGMKGEYVAKMCVMPQTDELPKELPFTRDSAKVLLEADESGLVDFLIQQMRNIDGAVEEEVEAEKKT